MSQEHPGETPAYSEPTSDTGSTHRRRRHRHTHSDTAGTGFNPLAGSYTGPNPFLESAQQAEPAEPPEPNTPTPEEIEKLKAQFDMDCGNEIIVDYVCNLRTVDGSLLQPTDRHEIMNHIYHYYERGCFDHLYGKVRQRALYHHAKMCPTPYLSDGVILEKFANFHPAPECSFANLGEMKIDPAHPPSTFAVISAAVAELEAETERLEAKNAPTEVLEPKYRYMQQLHEMADRHGKEFDGLTSNNPDIEHTLVFDGEAKAEWNKLKSSFKADTFGAIPKGGYIQYFLEVPLIFEESVGRMKSAKRTATRQWMREYGIPLYQQLVSYHFRSTAQALRFAEVLCHVHNICEEDIIPADDDPYEERVNPGYRMLKERALEHHCIGALTHLLSFVVEEFEVRFSYYVAYRDTLTGGEVEQRFSHLYLLLRLKDALLSRFQMNPEKMTAFWLPDQDDLIESNLRPIEEFITTINAVGKPTPKDRFMMEIDAEEVDYQVSIEQAVMRRLYGMLCSAHKDDIAKYYEPETSLNPEEQVITARELVESHTPVFDDWYKPTVDPAMGAANPRAPQFRFKQKTGKLDTNKKPIWEPTNQSTIKRTNKEVKGVNPEGDTVWTLPVPQTQMSTRGTGAKKAPRKSTGAKKAPAKVPKKTVLGDDEDDLFVQADKAPLPDDDDEFNAWMGE